MLYKNISCSAKTFYGVEFKPGEIKEVPGYINHPKMIVTTSLPQEDSNKQSKPQEKQKKPSDKTPVIQSSNSEVKPEDATPLPLDDENKSSSSKD